LGVGLAPRGCPPTASQDKWRQWANGSGLFVERQTIVRRTANDCSSNGKRLFVERKTIVRRTSADGDQSFCENGRMLIFI
jgi:hypothetical protein